MLSFLLRIRLQTARGLLTIALITYSILQMMLQDHPQGSASRIERNFRRRTFFRRFLQENSTEFWFTTTSPNETVLQDIYLKLERKVEHNVQDLQSTCTSNVKLLRGHPRQKQGFLTLGLTTVPRENVFYLPKTLDSLISKMTEEEKAECVIIVFLGSDNDTWVNTTLTYVDTNYKGAVTSGLLQVVQPDFSIYPYLRNISKRNFNDSITRVRWRTKQNLDFAHIFAYCENISTFYIHVEDDVTAATSYIHDIKSFIKTVTARKQTWFVLEYSLLGFIGKLFRSSDLCMIYQYLMLFNDEKPCDMLIEDLKHIKTQGQDIRSPKSLFQHFGRSSSLEGKIQPLQDKNFKDSSPKSALQRSGFNILHRGGEIPKFYGTPNPPGKVVTSMITYGNYRPENPYYRGSSQLFWTKSPKDGDYYRILFTNPTPILAITVKTGSSDQATGDTLLNGVLNIGSTIKEGQCLDSKPVGNFRQGKFEKHFKTPVLANCIEILVTQNQTNWLIISEIHITTTQVNKISNSAIMPQNANIPADKGVIPDAPRFVRENNKPIGMNRFMAEIFPAASRTGKEQNKPIGINRIMTENEIISAAPRTGQEKNKPIGINRIMGENEIIPAAPRTWQKKNKPIGINRIMGENEIIPAVPRTGQENNKHIGINRIMPGHESIPAAPRTGQENNKPIGNNRVIPENEINSAARITWQEKNKPIGINSKLIEQQITSTHTPVSKPGLKHPQAAAGIQRENQHEKNVNKAKRHRKNVKFNT